MAQSFELVGHGKGDKVWKMKEFIPKSPKSGEVLVEVEYFGINFADVMARLGMYQDAPPLPFVPGYEAAGKVLEVGDDVEELKVGDSVLILCAFGGYSTHLTVSLVNAVRLSPDVNPAEALMMAVQGLTASYCLKIATNCFKGDKVLVHAGAGGVGSIAIQLAKQVGATVYSTCSTDEKANFIKSLRADQVINYTEDGWYDKLKASCDGDDGFDIILDSLGGSTIGKNLDLLCPGGRLVCMGVSNLTGSSGKSITKLISELAHTRILHPLAMMSKNQSFISVNMLNISQRRNDVVRDLLVDLVVQLEEKWIKTKVHKVYSHTELDQAHEDLQHRKTLGNCVIRWDK